MIQELKDLLKKEAEQQGKEFELEWASTLSELGYNFKDTIKKLKEAGIPIVFTESEKKEVFEDIKKAYKDGREWMDFEFSLTKDMVNNQPFESISDIIMIHKTDYPPRAEKIESRHSGNVLHECKVTLAGEEYEFTCKSGRDSVHLSANHEVSGNNGGDWSEKRYAVIVPFEDLKKFSTIKSAQSVDTYTQGPVTLTENCYILCPKDEVNIIQSNNPIVTVIGYEGEIVQDFANALISLLGYKLEFGNDHGFADTKQGNIYFRIMEKEGIPVKKHYWSEEKKREDNLGIVYQIVGLMKLIKDKKILEKVDKNQLIEELNSQHFANMVRSVFRIDSEYNDVMIEELKEVGIDISIKGIQKAIEKHVQLVDGSRTLDMKLGDIITEYMLDSISSRDKDKKFSTGEIGQGTQNVSTTTKRNADGVKNKGIGKEENTNDRKGEEVGDDN